MCVKNENQKWGEYKKKGGGGVRRFSSLIRRVFNAFDFDFFCHHILRVFG